VTLDDVLHGEVVPGVHVLDDPIDPSDAAERVRARGWTMFHVDGSVVVDKRSFLAAMAEGCGFPKWFGHNWDALADALRDLSWAPAPGYVVLVDHSARYRAHTDWPLVTEIFDDVVSRWAEDITPFFFLVR
jgi:hypothetical protein